MYEMLFLALCNNCICKLESQYIFRIKRPRSALHHAALYDTLRPQFFQNTVQILVKQILRRILCR